MPSIPRLCLEDGHDTGQGDRVDTDDWARKLAREFAPYEELIAGETVRRYAGGGRTRRSLLRGAGEGTGGFDGAAVSGDLVHILEALRHGGNAVLAVLQHPAVGGAAGLGSAVIALIESQRARRARQREAEPTEVRVTIEVSPQDTEAVYLALDQLADQLAVWRQDQDEAWDQACRLLDLLARDPQPAAGFVRSLDPSLRRGPAGPRQPAWRRFPRKTTTAEREPE
jgi:hypothetical protein